jgi:NAD(P)-dependent dehydrogenase (short-subunit alcohol dehydrogenase family)
VAEAGPFDVLVNNAGVDQPGVFFSDVTPEQWRRLLAVNLEGVFACTQAVLPAMQAAGYGRIVNMSSEAGRMGAKANAVYAAAKGAIIAFSKSIAQENARYGITVNAVAPGPIETPLLRRMDPRAIETVTASTLVRRLGQPEEVAAAVAFLASAEASYITGETLAVSGGMFLGA